MVLCINLKIKSPDKCANLIHLYFFLRSKFFYDHVIQLASLFQLHQKPFFNREEGHLVFPGFMMHGDEYLFVSWRNVHSTEVILLAIVRI